MVEQAKILRIFKLIGQLKSRPKSIKRLSDELEITTRTVYRYITLLEEIGFVIDKNWQNQYFIHTSIDSEEDEVIHFTDDEAKVIRTLISTSLDGHPLRESLLKKLFLNSELKELPDQILKARNGRLVSQIVMAQEVKKQVILKNYHSARSGDIRDRVVEPFGFSTNYETIIAYEVETKSNKQFKVERVGSIVELNKNWKHQSEHEIQQTDAFGFTGKQAIHVNLQMSLKAYLLLREEFPKSVPYLSKSDEMEDVYLFSGPIYDFLGIGRFIMGLSTEVDVIDPVELKEYIRELCDNLLEKLNSPGD